MHNRLNIKNMQTIAFSGKIVSALWRWFKGRFENKVDRGCIVVVATPRHVAWQLPMRTMGASQAHVRRQCKLHRGQIPFWPRFEQPWD